MQDPIFTDRETAREKLTAKLEREQRLLAKIEEERKLPASCRTTFTTFSPNWIIEDAEWRLRWLDCAPEGANHQLAPLQDKNGVPMGGVYNENVGPGEALRNARAAHGRNPLSGAAA